MPKVAVDWIVAIPLILLGTISILMLSSVAPNLANQQLLFMIIGVIAFLVTSRISFAVWKSLGWHLWLTAIALLCATIFFGIASRGSVRWIDLFGIRVQPSELVKPLLIISSAVFVTAYPPVTIRRIALHAVLMAVPIFLVFRQPDLGSTLVIAFTLSTMLFLGGLPIKAILFSLPAVSIGLPWLWHHLADYQRERIISFLDPTRDPLGSGYSTIQSIIAVGSGQLLGRGLGRGVQSQLQFLPEYYTDFIFASLAEELGFLGVMVLVALYAILIGRCLWISFFASDQFVRLSVGGVAALVLFQTAVNISINMGLLPVTGITLPFVSYGGSSLVSLFVMLGLVSACSAIRRAEVDTRIEG